MWTAQKNTKKLIFLIVPAFIIFFIAGLFVGSPKPSENTADTQVQNDQSNSRTPDNKVERVGKVIYTDPSLYPQANISYKLIDKSGKDIALLTASDDKLKVIEGATVKVKGTISKIPNLPLEVLNVEQIIFSN